MKGKRRSLKPKPIKESRLDIAFSLWIRARDRHTCQRCFRSVPQVQIQNSHFFTRNARSTRWDPMNCDALCAGCHRYFEVRKNGEYRDWKIKQLSEPLFKELSQRYYTLKKWTDPEKRELYEKYKIII